jgi:hypothetical protein
MLTLKSHFQNLEVLDIVLLSISKKLFFFVTVGKAE